MPRARCTQRPRFLRRTDMPTNNDQAGKYQWTKRLRPYPFSGRSTHKNGHRHSASLHAWRNVIAGPSLECLAVRPASWPCLAVGPGWGEGRREDGGSPSADAQNSARPSVCFWARRAAGGSSSSPKMGEGVAACAVDVGAAEAPPPETDAIMDAAGACLRLEGFAPPTFVEFGRVRVRETHCDVMCVPLF